MAGEGTASGLRANRNWLRLWLGQAVSITGDYIFYVTVTLWIATVIARGQSWAPAAVGGALIAAAIPALVVGPLAGVYVDRWNRRRTMMTADAARALLIAALLALPLAGRHLPATVQIGILYAVLAAASCFTQFFSPSRMAIIGAVVDPADLPRAASGLLQATGSFASIIGPPIAAPLLFVVGVQWALIVNAASFAVSFLMLQRMHVTEPGKADRTAQASFFEEFRAGVRFFRGSPVLITLTVGVVIATLGTGALNALMVFLPHNLHVAAKWLGTLLAGLGLGAIAGALLTGQVARRMPSARIFWLGLVLTGIALVGFSRTTLLLAAICVIALLGVIVGLVNSVIMPLMLEATPQHLLGRVNAVINPVQELASILSMAAAGFLASTVLRGMHEVIAGVTFGPYDTIFAVSGLLFVVAGFASIIPMRGTGRAASNRSAADPAADHAGSLDLPGPGTGPASSVS